MNIADQLVQLAQIKMDQQNVLTDNDIPYQSIPFTEYHHVFSELINRRGPGEGNFRAESGIDWCDDRSRIDISVGFNIRSILFEYKTKYTDLEDTQRSLARAFLFIPEDGGYEHKFTVDRYPNVANPEFPYIGVSTDFPSIWSLNQSRSRFVLGQLTSQSRNSFGDVQPNTQVSWYATGFA